MKQTENKRPTLLEWLKSKSDSQLATLGNIFPESRAYSLAEDLQQYGLLALDVWFDADTQHYIISQYVNIYQN